MIYVEQVDEKRLSIIYYDYVVNEYVLSKVTALGDDVRRQSHLRITPLSKNIFYIGKDNTLYNIVSGTNFVPLIFDNVPVSNVNYRTMGTNELGDSTIKVTLTYYDVDTIQVVLVIKDNEFLVYPFIYSESLKKGIKVSDRYIPYASLFTLLKDTEYYKWLFNREKELLNEKENTALAEEKYFQEEMKNIDSSNKIR